MERIRYILLLCILVTGQTLSYSQDDISEHENRDTILIIDDQGREFYTSEIFERQTNEDQVVFENNGQKKTLSSSEVKAYIYNGKKSSIEVGSENKLVSILLIGTIGLAKSKSSGGEDIFYVNIKEEWSSLLPHSTAIKHYLTSLLPDVDEIIKTNKVYYNIESLGKVVSFYNENRDPSYKMVGKFEFPHTNKFGFFAAVGLTQLDISEYPSNFESSLETVVGVETEFKFTRIFSTKHQLSYSQNRWGSRSWDISFRTLNITTLINAELYNNFRNLRFSAAFGVNLNLDLRSSIVGSAINNDALGLQLIGFGYDTQLHCQFGRHLNVFVSYQLMNALQSKKYGLLRADKSIAFTTNSLRIGSSFVF